MDTAAPDNQPPAPIRIMVFAAERFGLSVPDNVIRNKQIILDFQPYYTIKKFDEYDGVIVFQETFERFSRHRGLVGSGGGSSSNCDLNELEFRQKELERLLSKQGFAIFLLHTHIQCGNTNESERSDLYKRYLLWQGVSYHNMQREPTGLSAKRDELIPYCSLYAVASTSFTFNYGMEKCVATLISHRTSGIVGFSIASRIYFLPAHFPKPNETNEFFELLTNAIVSINKKDRLALPAWVNDFKVSGETECDRKLDELEKQKTSLVSQQKTFEAFKHVLCSTGQRLVADAANLLKNGLGLSIDETDSFREDLKLLDVNNKPFAFVEVKGVNGNVTREQVNQADSHRERADLPESFPSLLLINTYIRSARSLEEKDTPPPPEQIAHAKKIGILIIRTIDLIHILNHFLNGKITKEEIIKNFSTFKGWWHSSANHVLVPDPKMQHKEEQP